MRYLLTTLLLPLSFPLLAQHKIDLKGTWQFQKDRNNTVTATSKYDDNIKLPGSMITRGKGDKINVRTKWTGSLYDSSFYFNPYMEKYRVEGQMKFPFFLTPETHYTGNAWYRRNVIVPKEWRKKRIFLTLERPHIETTIYINGKEMGHQMGLSAPHIYDITEATIPGKENSIAIKVYNGIENVCVGQDSHSVTDQTQGNWNGIAGEISLSCRPVGYISHVDVFPDVKARKVRIVVKGMTRKKCNPVFIIDGSERKAMPCGNDTYEINIGENMRTWDEYDPYVYHLTVKNGEDSYETVFGMRTITVKGMDIMLNDKPLYVRGTVENCCFPETGYPPTDPASWEKIILKCKEYGINTMRFHSYCPPEAAFAVADRLGFYLQPEGPSWPNHGVKLKAGQYIDTYLMEETKRTVEAYGNHPSFVMMSAGNEPAGNWVAWCNEWVDYWKNTDSRRIYCGANVGGGWAWDNGSQYHVKGGARGLDWDKHAPQSMDDYYKEITFPRNYKATTPNNSPIISHEQGQWCAFPDFKERSQYTGAYKAKNFDIFEDLLRDNGMAGQAEKFLHASGKLQVLAYKYEMERNYRTKDYTGFVLLGLNDYSGQGCALVGPLNVHWKEKGYVTADEWKEFCSDVIPLARFSKFVYSNSDTLSVPVEVYNASQCSLIGAYTSYEITSADSGNVLFRGTLANGMTDIPRGKNNAVSQVVVPLHNVMSPKKLTLTVNISTANGKWKNHWDFWVYPDMQDIAVSKDVYIADSLDDKVVKVLEKGGKVLLTAAGKVRYGQDIKQYYLPVFWNTSWFKMRPPHITGAYIDRNHAMFSDFPTDDWTNINWWELVNRAQVMNLSEFPADYQPPVQPIDTWHVSRKCGMVIEANVLNGKLLMTTIDITNGLDHRLVARQLRKSILEYMDSEAFRPTITLDKNVIQDLYTKQAKAVDMFTNDSPDELKPKLN